MIVKNPTDNEIRVQIKGTRYVIAPQSEIANVPEGHASHWKTHVHNFVILKKDVSTVALKEVEEKTEEKKPEPKKEEVKKAETKKETKTK